MKAVPVSIAAALACSLSLAAQPPARPPSQKMSDEKNTLPSATIKVAGCVQKETDVLKHSIMTGSMGMGDEFVLTQVQRQPDESTTKEPEEKAEQPAATTASASNFGKVYRVTGDKESELKSYVGQRVEIIGTFKHEEDAKNELGATGTSGRTPTGELTAANTPELTINSIRPIPGSCSGSAK